jgi:transposase
MRKTYDKEFKVMICELLLSGQSAKTVAEEYGVDVSTVRKWKKLYKSNKEPFTGSGKPSLSPEEKEIRELKKRLKESEMEREILKKAVAIFSVKDRKSMGS